MKKILSKSLILLFSFVLVVCTFLTGCELNNSSNVSSSSVEDSSSVDNSSSADNSSSEEGSSSSSLPDKPNEDEITKVLIIEGKGIDSSAMKNMLEELNYLATIVSPSSVPRSLNELLEYDQVILANVNARDLSNEFSENLNKFVYDYGGGLLTTGGDNSYYYGNMQGTLIESMLPVVVAPEYPKYAATMIVLDASGSMYYDIDKGGATQDDCFFDETTPEYQNTRMKYTKDALINASMTIFGKNDYIGLIHFGKTSNQYPIVDLPLTTAVQPGQFIYALDNGVKTIAGTSWKEPLEEAINQLNNFYAEKSKSIIFITDGDPQDSYSINFKQIAQDAYEDYGISISTIAISNDITSKWRAELQDIASVTKGRFYECYFSQEIRQAIEGECKMVTYSFEGEQKSYAVEIKNDSLITNGVLALPNVKKYNKLVIKQGADEIAVVKNDDNSFVREDCLYACWKYGKGNVGSFASSFSDEWASSYYSDNNGKTFLQNAVTLLLP